MIKLAKEKYFLVIFIATILVAFLISFISIYSGSIPFWFDPARDFIQGLSNQTKVSLIGEPTGIPGLFYGPYWIWLLSAALLVSKDPRVVQFLVLALPYFLIFPFILYKLRKVFGFSTSIILWILFIFGFLRYTVFPWNPHLAPLLVLGLFYLLIAKVQDPKQIIVRSLTAGLTAGLIGNFHISFALGLLIGIALFFVIEYLLQPTFENFRKMLMKGTSFSVGLVASFLPFILFESRHGFNQVRVILDTVLSSYAVVGIKGLDHDQILQRFFQVFSELLYLPKTYAVLLVAVPLLILIYRIISKKVVLSTEEKSLLILCFSTVGSILFVYFTSKNPVWEYHFIAVEVLILLLIGVLSRRLLILRILLALLATFILTSNIYTQLLRERPNVLSYDTLAKKEYIVKLIDDDSKGGEYTVFTYNPGIYSYEFSYLFKWLANKDVPYDPGQIERGGDIVYLIIQKTDPAIYQDYINSHAGDSEYKTSNVWHIEDGTTVIKRERLK